MANTIEQILLPEEAQFLGSSFPQFTRKLGSAFPVSSLAYDASSDESAFWVFRALNYGSGSITLTLDWYADTATSGTVVWEAQLAAITPGDDSQDVETKTLDTLNFVQDTHLGTTGQRLHQAVITLANVNSLAAGDLCWLRVARDANATNATDSASGDAHLVSVTVSYSDT